MNDEGYGSMSDRDIAVIGMSGSFPRAKDLDTYWQNLQAGVEAVTFFNDEELREAGVEEAMYRSPNYVKAGAILEEAACFDAEFFGYSPREAAFLDPQQRLFLEHAWKALENAGYVPGRYEGLVGVYASVSWNLYLLHCLSAQVTPENSYQVFINNDKDFLPTRVSYKLDLKGPSVTVQTACSSSLVGIHLACLELLNYECDMALAGGTAVKVPPRGGYFYMEGGLNSPDGHCRVFDAKAQGTIFGSGVGIVVLKRLLEAVEDGDRIYAVIKGSAINNDGAVKASYTAPSVEGQAEVIAAAQAIAEVEPEEIGYVEAHGTGTAIGDPIEVAALTRVFRAQTEERGFCAIGSVKSSVGHLDAAAGVAGFIKTVLALDHKKIPASLHFEEPNPRIDFENSPFYVNAELREWESNGQPRRAGVSSFGVGGTNAHIIVEEAPVVRGGDAGREECLVVLSAKTEEALEQMTANLAAHLRQPRKEALADVAYTLQVGRKAFAYRRVVVSEGREGAAEKLEGVEGEQVFSAYIEPKRRHLYYMFPGQGAQYVNMGRGLYEREKVFREEVDRCVALLEPHLGFDLREIIYPREGEEEGAAGRLQQTGVAQPALFVVEYALGRLWQSWGLRAEGMIGHSIGEYVAACLGGGMGLEDGLRVVARRGELMEGMPSGAMLAVMAGEDKARSMLGDGLWLAAVNGPGRCTLSGREEAIGELQARLEMEGVSCRRLHTSHAFHSAMMEPMLEEFRECVEAVDLKPPEVPFVSNVTGRWIEEDEATDAGYWVRHVRETVQFGEGLGVLLEREGAVLLEVGPGRTLATLARQRGGGTVFTSLRHPRDEETDERFMLTTLGRLWLSGMEVDWQGFYGEERRLRVPLPTYPFARNHYWIEPVAPVEPVGKRSQNLSKRAEIGDWFYVPVWKQSVLLEPGDLAEERRCWLVFCDRCGVGDEIVERLERVRQDVVRVVAGTEFRQVERSRYAINPGRSEDYDSLLEELSRSGRLPERIVHLWNVTESELKREGLEDLERVQDLGFYSLVFLAQGLGRWQGVGRVELMVVSSGLQMVTGEEEVFPEKATLLGPCRVIPQEYDNVGCRSIDIEVGENGEWQEGEIERLLEELAIPSLEPVVAYRGKRRWVEAYEPVWIGEGDGSRLREGGVYLITGGLGGIGLALAEHLVRIRRAKLALISRSGLPEREEWGKWMEDAPAAFAEEGQQVVGVGEVRINEDLIGQWEDELEETLGIKDLGSYEGLEEELDSLCLSYIYEYLVSGGVDTGEGIEYGKEEIREQLGIQPDFERFYDFMLRVLKEEGVIGIEGKRIKFLGNREVKDARELSEKMEERYPGFTGLLGLLAYCVGNYRAALSGEIEAIGVLYPGGSDQVLRESREKTVEHDNARINLTVVGRIIGQVAEKIGGRRLRILEVGGGGGGLTRHLIPELSKLDVEYHFTDIGKMFVVSAEQEAKARGVGFMQFGVLDISRDPLEQGYEAGSFDVILGYDVVHATRSIRESVGNLKKLLAPGGLICLVERVKLRRWVDMVWGLAKGWWYYEDEDLREGSPLLSLEEWEEALGASGFEEVKAYPRDGKKRVRAESGLIVARLKADAGAASEERLRTQRRIRHVQDLEALGGEVLVIGANVTDREQMKRAVSQVYDRFGTIHGVIHAAGIVEDGVIQLKTREIAAQVLAPKVEGALVLEEMFGQADLDFIVLFSSQSSVIPMPGQVDYCAANAFLDAFARYVASVHGLPALSINWGAWQNIGMRSAMRVKRRSLTGEGAMGGMLPGEGLEAFDRVLRCRSNQILVSPQDLEAVVEERKSPLRRGVSESTSVSPPGTRHSRPALSDAYEPPRSAVERTIVKVWQELLGIEQVGIHDNFFELGGDSLLAMQVVSRARQNGVEFTPQLLLEHPTVAELAAVQGQTVAQDEQGLVTGPLPLSISQHWFFETDFIEPNRWDVNPIFEVRQTLDPVLVGQVVQHLLVHHDALRSRFVCDESGWRGFITEPDDVVPVICVDLSNLSEAECAAEMWQIGDDIQGSLDLADGPLLRVGVYDRGANRSGYLIIVVHHIVMDARSTTVLVEDFQMAYQQLARGEQIQLLPKTTSLKQWLEQLVAYAQSAEMRQELDYWLGLPWSQIHPLPVDYPEGVKDNTTASMSSVEVRLSAAETSVLLRQVPKMYNTQILDVLLMAMVQAVTEWTGGEWAPITLVDSGRGAILTPDNVDLSRTIGWLDFTGFILLKRPDADNPGDALRSIRDQFRNIPNRGLGFDLLCRLSGDDGVSSTLNEFYIDSLVFNYIGNIGGQVDERAKNDAGLMQRVSVDVGNWQNPQNKRSSHLFCPAFIAEGQLVVRWEYSKNIHEHAAIEAVAKDFIGTLRALIAHVNSEDSGATDQRRPERPTTAYPAVREDEDVTQEKRELVTGPVPMMPTQAWFLNEGGSANPNHFVISAMFEVARLDPGLLKQAVHALLLHHDVLRARFVREESGWRQFIVEPNEETPFAFIDFSEVPAGRHREEIEFAASALQNAIDLSNGPLIQVALFDLGIGQTGRLLLHVHHLASDGYSQRILFEDLKTVCLQLGRGGQVRLPPKTTSFKEWSKRLNAYARSEELREEWDYWRTYPWAQIPPLPVDYPEGVDCATTGSLDYLSVELSVEETSALLRLLAAHGFKMLEALLMALVDTLAKWSGQRRHVLNVLDSGRNAIPAARDVDLSRTMGYLALSRIMVLEHEDCHPLDALQAIWDQIHQMPSHGFGLTLLYFCGGDEVAGRLGPQESQCKPELLFNYLGQVGEGMEDASDEWVIGKAPEKTGPYRDPEQKLSNSLGLGCTIEIKKSRLVVQWRYSNVIHKHATAKQLIDGFVRALRALIACAESESSTQSVPQPYLEYSAKTGQLVGSHVSSLDMQGRVTGSVPLLPTQAWFLNEGFDNLDRFILQNMFEVVRLDPGLLEQAVRILLLHHDMLRVRFVREESGWRQFIIEPDEQTPFALLDFSEVPADRHTEVIEFAAEALQHAISLSKGPMIQVAFFDLGVNRTGRLLIHMHHLVSDNYSQNILIEDLQAIGMQLAQGDRVRLLPKTTSFKRWAERLNAYIWSDELREERDYWLTHPWTQVAPLPADYPENRERGTIGSLVYFYFELSVEETVTLQQLLRERGFQMLDASLMALVETLAQWSGEHRHLINVMDAGRSVIPGAYDIDLSRTVGYLALSRMMILERGVGGPWDALRTIRDQVHQMPSGGFGYTLLYHCGGAEIAAKLEPRCRHDIQFNYLGQEGQGSDRFVNEWVLGRAKERTGWYQDPGEKISDLLGCSAQIKDRLVVRWSCSEIIHKRTTIERLADGFLDALRALITCSAKD